MLTDSLVGQWTERANAARTRTTRRHLVDSVIEDRVVTACGKSMEEEASRGTLLFRYGPDAGACRVCLGLAKRRQDAEAARA